MSSWVGGGGGGGKGLVGMFGYAESGIKFENR